MQPRLMESGDVDVVQNVETDAPITALDRARRQLLIRKCRLRLGQEDGRSKEKLMPINNDFSCSSPFQEKP